jgi:hypothetical protein
MSTSGGRKVAAGSPRDIERPMLPLNRDTLAAIVLLVMTGVFFIATFDIRTPDYGQLSPTVWPRTILVVLTILLLIYLVQSLRRGDERVREEPVESLSDGEGSIAEKALAWRNIFWCFGLFLLFLLTLPWLGMLVGGMAFVFLLLTALGGWTPRLMAVHAAVAVLSVGGMWSLFTFGLGVFLPQGELFGAF